MTEAAAKELLRTIKDDIERTGLRHFVVYAKQRDSDNFLVVIGTVFRDILLLDQPGQWSETKWMLGLENKT